MLRRVSRAPLTHFLVVGALLFTVERTWGPLAREVGTKGQAPIVVSLAQRALLCEEFERTTRAPCTADAAAALVAQKVDDELLYREALARGLAVGDRSIQWQLAEKMRFLSGQDDTGGDTAALAREAATLGLDRDDAVVRRMLIEKLRLVVKQAVSGEVASEDVLRAYFCQHGDDYRAAPRVTLWHVFLGASPLTAQVARWRRAGTQPAEAARAAASFPIDAHIVGTTGKHLGALLGAQVARAAESAPLERWVGPVASVYGWHALWVAERVPGELPAFAAVRPRVERAWRAEEQGRRVSTLVGELRRGARIVVEPEEPHA